LNTVLSGTTQRRRVLFNRHAGSRHDDGSDVNDDDAARDLDELQDGEPLTMSRRAPRSGAMRDAAREVLGISRIHVSQHTPSRVGARVSARVRPEGSAL
jgi:hypothetical protein